MVMQRDSLGVRAFRRNPVNRSLFRLACPTGPPVPSQLD